jgi:hypothetical protein
MTRRFFREGFLKEICQFEYNSLAVLPESHSTSLQGNIIDEKVSILFNVSFLFSRNPSFQRKIIRKNSSRNSQEKIPSFKIPQTKFSPKINSTTLITCISNISFS